MASSNLEYKTCPKCGKQLRIEAKFCGGCGSSLVIEPKIHNNQNISEITCPNCGKTLRAGAKFCGGCGTSIQEPKKKEMQEKAEAKLSTKAETKKSETKETKCPNCGKVLRAGAKFCGGCGTSLSEESRVQKSQEQPKIKPEVNPERKPEIKPETKSEKKAQADSQIKIETTAQVKPEEENKKVAANTAQTKGNLCPNCGKVLREGAKFCGGCGTVIESKQAEKESVQAPTDGICDIEEIIIEETEVIEVPSVVIEQQEAESELKKTPVQFAVVEEEKITVQDIEDSYEMPESFEFDGIRISDYKDDMDNPFALGGKNLYKSIINPKLKPLQKRRRAVFKENLYGGTKAADNEVVEKTIELEERQRREVEEEERKRREAERIQEEREAEEEKCRQEAERLRLEEEAEKRRQEEAEQLRLEEE
ncbi:MAG: zinc ribbon domain-containing protein, partial [Ruminococcus sp.]|nr:zinc ribbon domain-containing protein [Ruminococcus sp.]